MKEDNRILIITFFLILFGLIMLFSSSSFIAFQNYKFNNDPYYFIKKQIVHVIIGIFFMFIAIKINLSFLKKIAYPSILISIILLILVLIIGKNINGAKRWINLGFFSLQVSKVAEIGLILFISKLIADIKNYSTNKIIFALLIMFVYIFLILIEPNFSSAILSFIYIFTLLMISDINKKLVLIPLSFAGIGIIALIPKYKHVITRLMSFVNKQPLSPQTEASLLALANGGLWGEGLGLGKLKLLFIPEAYSDFIFSIIGEELGIMGAIIIIILFIWLAYEGILVCKRTKSIFNKMLAFSITFLIFTRAMVHISISIKLLPTTGLGLPFISYGGTAIIINMILIGLLVNISKHTERYV